MPAGCDVRHDLRLAVAGGHISCGCRSLGSGGRSRVESRFIRVVRPGRRVCRIFCGAFLFGKRVRADSAFPDLALQGGKVALGVVESRGMAVLFGDEDVMLLVILVVC